MGAALVTWTGVALLGSHWRIYEMVSCKLFNTLGRCDGTDIEKAAEAPNDPVKTRLRFTQLNSGFKVYEPLKINLKEFVTNLQVTKVQVNTESVFTN